MPFIIPTTVVGYHLVPNTPVTGGLTMAYPGSPLFQTPMFDVIAAINLTADPQGRFWVCDNAIKLALDESPWVERI